MAQAKVLSEAELKRVLAIVAGRRHADRDRLALLLTHWAGMRVCEVAALRRSSGPFVTALGLLRAGTMRMRS